MCNLALPGKHLRSFQQLDRRLDSLERTERKEPPPPPPPPSQVKPRLTACHFGQALGLWKGQRLRLWQQKSGIVNGISGELFDRLNSGPLDAPAFTEAAARTNWVPRLSPPPLAAASPRKAAILWGLGNEPEAIRRYSSISGSTVNRETRFTIYNESDELYDWIGALPDALVEEQDGGDLPGKKKENEEARIDRDEKTKNCSGGILEVKCPPPHRSSNSFTIPYFYVPQAQGLMEILDRDWLDFYIWTPDVSRVLRIERDRHYWGLIFRVMSDFWWGNVLPARREALLGDRGNPGAFLPADTHPLTPAVIESSRELAAQAKVLWTDRIDDKRSC